jgi:hypothetical protein
MFIMHFQIITRFYFRVKPLVAGKTKPQFNLVTHCVAFIICHGSFNIGSTVLCFGIDLKNSKFVMKKVIVSKRVGLPRKVYPRFYLNGLGFRHVNAKIK